MAPKTLLLLKIIFALAFISCSKVMPAGFWENYQKGFIKQNISDQGPYGGHRAIYWQADKQNPFNPKDVFDFTKKSDWTFVDSLHFNEDETNKWTYFGKPVFPLTSTGFSGTLLNDAHLTDFPRWFGGSLTVYKFKTDRIIIEPGTDNAIEVNGFVVINNDKTEMAVYHLWGE